MSIATEKTIILTAAEVAAILDGRKTRKRVAVVLNKVTRGMNLVDKREARSHAGISYRGIVSEKYPQYHLFEREGAAKIMKVTCPFGAVGERLVVREPWAYGMDARRGVYGGFLTSHNKEIICYAAGPKVPSIKWMPATAGNMMPRHFSRMMLVVAACGVERLWDVDDAGARAEGFNDRHDYQRAYGKQNGFWSWGENPFMWVMDFEVVDTSKDVWEWQNTLTLLDGGHL